MPKCYAQLPTFVRTLICGSFFFASPLFAQSDYPFVSDSFEVPSKLETSNFRIRALTLDDVAKDYSAAMSSVDHLLKVWPGSGWPKDLTIEEDLIALGWHQQEFINRTSFAYTVLTLDESRVIGSVYVNPTRKSGHDAEIFLWVTKADFEAGLDLELFSTVTHWIDDDWPFEAPAFPGRKVSWERWNSTPDEKW